MAHFDLIDWNAAALWLVELTRAPVYDVPRLKKGTGTRSTQGKRASGAEHRRERALDAESRRRRETRRLNGELSRYYQLGVNKSEWGCPDLLSRGKHGVIARNHDISLTSSCFSAGRPRESSVATCRTTHLISCLTADCWKVWDIPGFIIIIPI